MSHFDNFFARRGLGHDTPLQGSLVTFGHISSQRAAPNEWEEQK